MNNAQISWYIVESDNSLAPYEDYYAGSFRPADTLEIKFSVWNNRWGQERIEDAIGCRASIIFDTIEDSVILPLFLVRIGDGEFETLSVQGNKGMINLGALSGSDNDGSLAAISNYKVVTLKIDNIPNNLQNSLKNMFVNLEFDSREGGI